jgi:methionyl aminopeptidase
MYKKYERNELCWCGSGKKYKMCHCSFDDRILAYERKGCIVPERDIIKTKIQIDGIRESGKINSAVLDYISSKIRIGMSTEDINQLVHDKTTELGGIPAPLGYEGFPKSVCTSVNNQVCHGIPSDKVVLCDGDIINVDVSTIYNGYFSDSSRMFCLGNVNESKRHLVETARKAIEVGLSQVKP